MHGVQGDLILRLIEGYNPSILNKTKWCFLTIRNKPVPFKLEEAIECNQSEVIIRIKDINSKPDAEQFLNYEVSVERKTPIRKNKTDNILLLIGYKIFNEGKLIGTIQNIENPGKQFLFVLENDLLIPVHEDLIERIDDKQKSIFMILPEGLV
jgi:16S rRNA processing protein RimM